MALLADLILGLTFLQWMIALINFIFRQPLKYKKPESQKIAVSILIPARNEAENLPKIINDLLEQEHQYMEIIVFNDQSTDQTASILESLTRKDRRISYIHGDALPKGWLGKNHACHQLAQHARGQYFLFLDADIRIHGDLITRALSLAQKWHLALLSIFPKQELKSIGEQLTVPLMHYILLSLLPLPLVRLSSFTSLSAANGQFMLFDAETYRKKQPHRHFKDQRVEDIHISRWYKKQKLNVACIAAQRDLICRMYHNYSEAINGFSKNIAACFGNSYINASLFWMANALGFIPVYVAKPMLFLWIYIFLQVSIRIFVSITANQDVLRNVIYAPLQILALGHIIIQAIYNSLNQKFVWKGRNIS